MKSLNYIFNQTREKDQEIKIMEFIKNHPDIKTAEELSNEIDKVAREIGKQTISDMAFGMHKKQEKYGTEYTQSECYEYILDLFTNKSLKGTEMEEKALKYLQDRRKRYKWRTATTHQDTKLNIDIAGYDENDELVVGVQVKPISYKSTDYEVKRINDRKVYNSKIETHYMYYNDKHEWSW